MAISDNPGLMTMPRTTRDWTKFINELALSLGDVGGDGGGGGGDVTIENTYITNNSYNYYTDEAYAFFLED